MNDCHDLLLDAFIFSVICRSSERWKIELPKANRRKPFSLAILVFLGVFGGGSDLVVRRHRFDERWKPSCQNRDDDSSRSTSMASFYTWESVTGHFGHVRIILTLLRNAGAALKLSKCFL